MKFKNRKEQRHVIELLDAILEPLKPYLNEDTKECITIAMRILREVGVESEDKE